MTLAQRLEQEADEITCYASTQSEYRPNKTAALLREAAKALLSPEGAEIELRVLKEISDELHRHGHGLAAARIERKIHLLSKPQEQQP